MWGYICNDINDSDTFKWNERRQKGFADVPIFSIGLMLYISLWTSDDGCQVLSLTYEVYTNCSQLVYRIAIQCICWLSRIWRLPNRVLQCGDGVLWSSSMLPGVQFQQQALLPLPVIQHIRITNCLCCCTADPSPINSGRVTVEHRWSNQASWLNGWIDSSWVE